MRKQQRAYERLVAERSSLTFREFVDRVNPRFKWYPHNVLLANVLQRVADGEKKRLMVFEPPRHGKSEQISRLFSAYYLYRYPQREVAVASYGQGLANTLSKNARQNYRRAGGNLKQGAALVKHWETEEGGALWACGVGGEATGKGFHLGIIDDPIKNAEAANSETIREKHKDWYRSTWYTRMAPDASLILIQTRWDTDDLAGFLLRSEESEDEQEKWHIVYLPAIKPEPAEEVKFPASCTVEPDNRKPGEALCPPRYPAERLKKIWRKLTDYFFSALYQQNPVPRSGRMFDRNKAKYYEALPADCEFVRYWDKAFTASGGAYSAGELWAKDVDGRFYVVDVQRGQWDETTRDNKIEATIRADNEKHPGVLTYLEQEPGPMGRDANAALIKRLNQWHIESDPARKDKTERARPLSSQWGAGNVYLKKGAHWADEFLDEYEVFPKGQFKDQVDAGSGAYNKLVQKGPSMYDLIDVY